MAEPWSRERKLEALESMMTIRRFEEAVVGLFQEHKLALAEILGRENGINRGAGGTMHMSEPDLGFISTSAIVGGSISLATGAGFALKTQGGDAIAVGLFGDGALEEGIAYESLNLGALWDLPVLYVCENNSEGALGYAGTQPLWPTLPTGETDISMAWDDSGASGEHEQWYREHDPVLRYARQLLASGDVSQEQLTEMDARTRERIAEARQFALESPRPTPESALDNVFA